MTKKLALLSVILFSSSPSLAKQYFRFTGGPTGGTFQIFANSIATFINQNDKDVKFSVQASGGSTENLRRIHANKAQFGVVHSGDLYLGRIGKLKGDAKAYDNVLALGILYKSAAQLAVLKNSGIRTLSDLKGKKVGIGGPGSGAAASAERFFQATGIWNAIDKQYIGYSKAASGIKDNQIDAMWVVSGVPTRAIIELGASKDMSLISLIAEANKHKLFKSYPFYKPFEIKKGSYDGIEPLTTFADSTVWVASKKVSTEDVYKSLKRIYSDTGIKYLSSVTQSAKNMSPDSAIKGIEVPLHPGAIKFWSEKGQKIPDRLRKIN